MVLVVMLATLGVSGAALDRLVAPVWAAQRAREPALRLDSSMAAAGQGVTLALLGGFRALVADATWVRAWALWEKRDLPGTETLVRLVVAMDPRPLYFWINGARILAYDFPVWRIEGAGGYDAVPASEQQRIEREQAEFALRHLEAAIANHPLAPDLWIERANIQLNRLHDIPAAAESYRRAWEQPNAPYYAARMHAELLRRAGRKAEALAFLVELHPRLPADDEAARADVVLGRIRELERDLGVPADRRYQPGR